MPTSNAGKTTLTVSKPSRLATWKVTGRASWSGRTRTLLWKSAISSEALLHELAVLRVADHFAVVVRAALAQPRLELLDLGREVLGDRHPGAGLGGEAEDDVVEDLVVAQLLHARVGAKVAEAQLAERGLAGRSARRAFETGCSTFELARQRARSSATVDWQAAVGEQRVALQRADVLSLLRQDVVGLALEFFEVSQALVLAEPMWAKG